MNKTLLACALAAASIGSASAATIIPVNMNAPGVGLNDPTPATPVGGNPGTTIGQQRVIAYQFAADLWGAILESEEPIRVRAQFTPLSCTATSGTLVRPARASSSVTSRVRSRRPVRRGARQRHRRREPVADRGRDQQQLQLQPRHAGCLETSGGIRPRRQHAGGQDQLHRRGDAQIGHGLTSRLPQPGHRRAAERLHRHLLALHLRQRSAKPGRR